MERFNTKETKRIVVLLQDQGMNCAIGTVEMEETRSRQDPGSNPGEDPGSNPGGGTNRV